MVAKYAAKRAKLKAEGDYEGLQKLPKNAGSAPSHALQYHWLTKGI